MEEKKSSFVDEFFPEKEAALPSKSDILSTIFPPQSPVAVKDSFLYEVSAVRATKQENKDQSLTEQMGASSGSFQVSPGKNQDGLKKNNEPNVPCEIAEPCLMSSSVYYGGRDDFIPEISSSYKSGSAYDYKKDSEDGNNSDVANRGEWWQGAVYTPSGTEDFYQALLLPLSRKFDRFSGFKLLNLVNVTIYEVFSPNFTCRERGRPLS